MRCLHIKKKKGVQNFIYMQITRKNQSRNPKSWLPSTNNKIIDLVYIFPYLCPQLCLYNNNMTRV